MAYTAAVPEDQRSTGTGRYRWVICALLFFATAINYMDRQILGLLAPLLQSKIGWNEAQYGYIVAGFQAAYAIGLLTMGALVDRLGVKISYAVALTLWTLASVAHAAVRTPLGFGVVRFALGLGESGNFPAAIKTVAEWFPKKERALATGIFNSGSNAGATLAPLFIPALAVHYGWQSAFIVTGLFSAVWIVCWLVTYRSPEEHPRVSAAELEYIRSDPEVAGAKIPWVDLLGYRQTWAVVIGRFLTDPIWWFFLFWLPKYFSSAHGISLIGLALPLIVIYNAASVGSIFGGWLAARLLQAGWTVNRARKTAMLVCACAVMPVVFAGNIQSLWGAIALVSVAAAGHQGWSANLYTMVSDVFPKRAVGSVVGMSGFGGAIGGLLIAGFTGLLLQATHSYVAIFVIAGFAYVTALFIIDRLIPNLEPAAIVG
jgi:ACS family hexuronate transporter-like MFS transporter